MAKRTSRRVLPKMAYYRISDLCHMLRCNKNVIYDLIEKKVLVALKQGRTTLITAASVIRYMASLPTYEGGPQLGPTCPLCGKPFTEDDFM